MLHIVFPCLFSPALPDPLVKAGGRVHVEGGRWSLGVLAKCPSSPNPLCSLAGISEDRTRRGGPLLGVLVCGLGGLESIAHAFACMGLGVSEGVGRGPAPWGWALAKRNRLRSEEGGPPSPKGMPG